MILNVSILFLSALFAGLSVFLIPGLDIKRFKTILSFSGAYLFSITVIHILPEIFHETQEITEVGIYVLLGFFLQMVLEYFSSGVEHGHIHVHEEEKSLVPYSMLISLCVHAFLEGTLLVHPSDMHTHNEVKALLFGLILHKIPEAFALMSVLVFRLGRKYSAFALLIIFSLATPLGMVLSSLIYSNAIISGKIFVILFAVVAGNFLYISTTIFFETSPNHKFKANKLLVSALGAVAAIIAEYLSH
ncbi:MAG: ZIP family metal transporter [Cytophagaceae bacterium]|nr:ZIP family metal transporter [Cytophagaceae bacterium]